MNRIKSVLFLLLILATCARLLVLIFYDNAEGSVPMGRLANALAILDNPSLDINFDGNTSVLHHYLLAAVLSLRRWPDPVVPTRIFTMLFGIFIIIPYYLLIRLLFNTRVAVWSSILLSLYPMHAIQSTLTMSDAIAYFFFFSSLYYLFKFKLEEKKLIWLVVSVLLLNITALLRYETWAFIPFLSAFLYKCGRRYSLSFFLLALISPLLWLYLCHHYTWSAFYSFITPARTMHAEILTKQVPYSKEISGWLTVLIRTLGSLPAIFGTCGIIYSFIKKRYMYLSILFLYLYSSYTFNTIQGRMWFHDRYSIMLALFILPYFILFIEKISNTIRLKPLILLSAFMFFSIIDFGKIAMRDRQAFIFPKEIKEIAGWLKLNVLCSEKLIITADPYNLTEQCIIVWSGVSPRNFFVINNPLPGFEVSDIKNDISNYIEKNKPAYFILNSNSILQEVVGFDMDPKKIKEFGLNFEAVYSKDTSQLGKFIIYKIHY